MEWIVKKGRSDKMKYSISPVCTTPNWEDYSSILILLYMIQKSCFSLHFCVKTKKLLLKQRDAKTQKSACKVERAIETDFSFQCVMRPECTYTYFWGLVSAGAMEWNPFFLLNLIPLDLLTIINCSFWQKQMALKLLRSFSGILLEFFWHFFGFRLEFFRNSSGILLELSWNSSEFS